MENLSLDGNFSCTHTQLDEYRNPITRVNYAGKLAPFVPELKNITNTRYYTFKIDSVRGVPSDPRLFGVRLAVSF